MWRQCCSAGHAAPLTFDNADALKQLTVSGDVSVDTSKDRGGVKGLETAGAAGWPTQGRVAAGGTRGQSGLAPAQKDGTGVLELWVYEDAAKPAKPRDYGAGAMWGLMQADGHMVAVGAIYAPYLNGAETYAAATLNPEKQKPWQQVTYLGGKRAPGWHKWTFDFDPDKGMRLLYDDQEVRNFNWNQSKLKGFANVVFFGDATDAKQTLWVDDVNVTLGPPARVAPVWPPPPPTPPADLTVLPPQAPWNPTPYAQWKNGPGKGEDYFPIAVWLQDPENAPRIQGRRDQPLHRTMARPHRGAIEVAARRGHAGGLRPERLRALAPERTAVRRLDARRRAGQCSALCRLLEARQGEDQGRLA